MEVWWALISDGGDVSIYHGIVKGGMISDTGFISVVRSDGYVRVKAFCELYESRESLLASLDPELSVEDF